MPHPSSLIHLIWPRDTPDTVGCVRPATAPVVGDLETQAREAGVAYGAYLERMHNHLDAATLNATLTLMLRECNAAIRKQRGLIGLDRLGQLDTTERMDRLDELAAIDAALTAALGRLRERGDLGAQADEIQPFGATIVRLRRVRH